MECGICILLGDQCSDCAELAWAQAQEARDSDYQRSNRELFTGPGEHDL